jgi:hypothetical protein
VTVAACPAGRILRPRPTTTHQDATETAMSKGMDRKKEDKKKPAKTLKEKRAEKKEKKSTKGFAPT